MVTPQPLKHPSTRSVPRWSPDGDKLLVELGRRPTIVDRELKEVAQLGPEDTWVTYPDWSPDGERVTYSYRGLHGEDPKPHWAVYSSKPDGTDVQLMSATGWRATWSPDSQKVAYHLVKLDSPFRVAVMDRDGSNETVLSVEDNPGNMTWTPDSDKVVYEGWNGDGGVIFQIDLKTHQKSRLLPNSQESDKSPAFSPDGQSVLFERFYSEGRKTEIRHLDLATGVDRVFANPHRSNHDAAWSPDGSQVVFSSNTEEDNSDLYLVDADGSNLRQLTNLPGDEHAPSWSPDGKSIAFYHSERRAGSKDVQILNLSQNVSER